MAIARVQTVAATAASSTTSTPVTITAAPDGALIVLLVTSSLTTWNSTNVASANTTWTKRRNTAVGAKAEIWEGRVSGGATGTTITVTHASVGGTATLTALEYSGASGATYDASLGGTSNATSTSPSSTAVTPIVGIEGLILVSGRKGGTRNSSAGGFTDITTTNGSGWAEELLFANASGTYQYSAVHATNTVWDFATATWTILTPRSAASTVALPLGGTVHVGEPPNLVDSARALPLAGVSVATAINARIAGGRVFTGASAAKVTIASTSALTDIAKNGRLSIMAALRVGTMANNLIIGHKSGGIGTEGWEFLIDNGPLRFLAGGVVLADTVSVASVVAGQFECVAADFDGTQGTLFRSAMDTPISEVVGGYATRTNATTPGSDAGEPLYLWNNAGSFAFSGDGIWVVIHDKAGRTSLDEKRIIQQGLGTCDAGDMVRGIAMVLSVSGCVGLWYLTNDGRSIDFSGNNNHGTLSGSTTAGETVNSDAAGASRSLVFAPTAFDHDDHPSPEQTTYRATLGYALKRFTSAAQGFRAWFRRTFNDPAYLAQEVLGYEINGAYTGTLASSVDGVNSVAVSGLSPSSKTIAFKNGPRSRRISAGTEPQEGSYLTLVYFTAVAAEPSLLTPIAVLAVLGDSIGEGYTGDPPGQKAAFQQLRYNPPIGIDAIVHLGFGGMQLNHVTVDAATQTAYVNRLVAVGTGGILIELGANDKINNIMSAATFQTKLAGLVDEIIATGYAKPIFLASTPITATAEGTNSFGDNLDAYRDTHTAVAATRTPQAHNLYLKPVVSLSNVPDVHPVNAGQDELAAFLGPAIATRQVGGSRSLPLSGVATATVGAGALSAASALSVPLGGSAQAAAELTAVSTNPVPLAGSATAAVALQCQSSAALPLSGGAAAAVALQATSSGALPLAGNGSAIVAIAAASSQAIPLAGSGFATVAIVAASTAPMPLGGTPTAAVSTAADSAAALPLGGSATAALGNPVTASSSCALPMSGGVTAAVIAAAASALPLPLGGSTLASGAVTAVSAGAVPLGGSAASIVLLTAVSSSALPLRAPAPGADVVIVRSPTGIQPVPSRTSITPVASRTSITPT